MRSGSIRLTIIAVLELDSTLVAVRIVVDQYFQHRTWPLQIEAGDCCDAQPTSERVQNALALRSPERRSRHLGEAEAAFDADLRRQLNAKARPRRERDRIVAGGVVRQARERQRVRFDARHPETRRRINTAEQRGVGGRPVCADK